MFMIMIMRKISRNQNKRCIVYRYVADWRGRIVVACKEGIESLHISGHKHREYANKITKLGTLTPGDKFLVSLPKKTNSLLISYLGPLEVMDKIIAVILYFKCAWEKENIPHNIIYQNTYK